jgi:hypothetical protein
MLDLWRHDFAPGAEEIFGIPPHKAKKFCELCRIPIVGDEAPIPDPVDGMATLESLLGEWQRVCQKAGRYGEFADPERVGRPRKPGPAEGAL